MSGVIMHTDVLLLSKAASDDDDDDADEQDSTLLWTVDILVSACLAQTQWQHLETAVRYAVLQ